MQAEIAIIGAGPAGMSAAVAASAHGKTVVVIDDNPKPGGQIWRNETNPDIDEFLQVGARLLPGHSVVAHAGPRTLLIAGEERAFELRYEKLILATGARERFLPFPGWTLPGVMGAGGLQAMVKGGLPIDGKRVVVAGSGPLLLAVAAYLRKRGARIEAIAEQAPRSAILRFAASLAGDPGKLAQATGLQWRLLGIPYRFSEWPVRANGARRLESVSLRRGTIRCDYLACGFGLVPNNELPLLLGAKIAHGFVEVDATQRTSIDGVYCAGEPTGIGGVDAARLEGRIAGLAASGADIPRRLQVQRDRWWLFRARLAAAFQLREELRRIAAPTTIVCRCEDVPLSALRESWRASKLHTRCGMGPCQGRTCGPIVEFLRGWPLESVRPPVSPCTAGQLAEGTDCEFPGLKAER